jgi:acetolactate decarboxylase
MGGLNVPGYHFHFLTRDRSAGGHVLAFELAQATVAVQELHRFHLQLPSDSAFHALRLGVDSLEEVRRVER